MSFLNFSLQRASYNDATPVVNPQQRNFDFNTNKTGLSVYSPVSQSKVVPPGQTILLDSTARTLAANMSTTEFSFSRPVASSDLIRIRYTGTGTAPEFRAARAISSAADTSVDIVAVSNTAKKIMGTAGTAFSFLAGGVVSGDIVAFQASDDTFTSPFDIYVQGRHFLIIDVTATSITVRDNGELPEVTGVVLGSDYADAMRVFSSSGVQLGDKVRFSSSSAFKTDNKAYTLEIVEVTDRDIYVVNPAALPEITVSGVALPFTIYDRLLNFLTLETNGPVKLTFNGTATIELAEYEPGATFFAGSISATSIHAINDTGANITVSLQTCSL